MAAVDTNLAKIAAKGISILVSSGDDGSGYDSGSYDRIFQALAFMARVFAVGHRGWCDTFCRSACRWRRNGVRLVRLWGRLLDEVQPGSRREVATTRSPNTSLQWTRRHSPCESLPATGRATPDISVLGEGYQIVVGGKVRSEGGLCFDTSLWCYGVSPQRGSSASGQAPDGS